MRTALIAICLISGPAAFAQSQAWSVQSDETQVFVAPGQPVNGIAVQGQVANSVWQALFAPQKRGQLPQTRVTPLLPTSPKPMAKMEPIPTQWPNAKFEGIPTRWPNLQTVPLAEPQPDALGGVLATHRR